MVRHTNPEEEANDENDATRFVRIAIEGRKAVESRDVVDKANSHHTAGTEMYGDDDFDDDGMYQGEDDVYAVVRFWADSDRPAYEVFDAVDELADDGWEVDREHTQGSFTSPVDRSGTFDQPVGTPPEDESKKNHRTKFVAYKQIFGGV